jgi:dolichyldiphosphatase
MTTAPHHPRQLLVAILFVIFTCSTNHVVLGKSSVSHPFGALRNNQQHKLLVLPKTTRQGIHSKVTSDLALHNDDKRLPGFVYFVNASSKWLIAAANLIGVWLHKEEGPFIVVGCIAASFLTENVLKHVINQGRPPGSPLSDPGMPSSHSLASFFLAITWMSVVGQRLLFLGLATLVATLRIVCGFHTLAQIAVGAILGSIFGLVWIVLGHGLQQFGNPEILRVCIWFAYVCGSVLFIWKIMAKWLPFLNTQHR